MQMRTDRGLPVRAAAAWAHVCTPPEAAPSAMDYHVAAASRRMSAVPTAATLCAYWQRKPPARRKTYHRPRDHEVEASGNERIYRCVRQREIDRYPRRRDLPRPRKHRRRDVYTEDMSGRAHFLRERKE